MNKTYFIKTYGCQMNVHESEKIAGILHSMNYIEADDMSNADVIVFNTCCIRETAEQKIVGNIGELTHIKRKNPKVIIAICGCMTQQNNSAEKLIQKFPFIDIVLGTHNIGLLKAKILQTKKQRKKIEISNDDTIENLPKYRTSGTNAWVNIIYGCNNFCTYCIVPYVRGRERSRTVEDILLEIKQLLEQGYKEITLLGQNVNSYGHDLEDKPTFAYLLEQICKFENEYNFRLRFMTSHPKDFNDDIINVIAQHHSLCKSIHLPIQSGSDSVLHAMNRKYTRQFYLQLVDKLRRAIPNVAITTDIMVGFPTETESDYNDTIDLIKKVRFSGVFTYVYSKRNGTPASEYPQIDSQTKKSRISKLVAVQNEIVNQISQTYVGNVYEILIDDKSRKTANGYTGRTDCGRLVKVVSINNIIGKFAKVKITKTHSAWLDGIIVEE